MDDQELRQSIAQLQAQQEKIMLQLARQENTRRDFWDKLAAISPVLSGIAIALSALLCTFQYNQQQIKLQEAQTVEKFIPHLMGNETSKRMAILAMKTLVNTDLAAKYAAMFPSQGTLSALQTIAKNGDLQDKKIVSQAMDKTLNELSGKTTSTDESSDSVANSQSAINAASPSNPALLPSNDSTTDSIPAQPSSDDTKSDTAQGGMEHAHEGQNTAAPTDSHEPEAPSAKKESDKSQTEQQKSSVSREDSLEL